MFLDIEKEIQRQELGIRSYGISMTTLEDVFLAISHEDHQPNRHYTVSKEKETNSNIGINKGSFGNYYESESVPISFDAISQNQDIESDRISISLSPLSLSLSLSLALSFLFRHNFIVVLFSFH
jgi:hypothetical protein